MVTSRKGGEVLWRCESGRSAAVSTGIESLLVLLPALLLFFGERLAPAFFLLQFLHLLLVVLAQLNRSAAVLL